MARRRRQHEVKSAEQLARQYAEEATQRAQLEDLFARGQALSRLVEAQHPFRTQTQHYIDRRADLGPVVQDFLNNLGQVTVVNIRLHQQIEDLGFRLNAVRVAKASGKPVPADSVQEHAVPVDMPGVDAMKFVMDLDAARRRSELRSRWTTKDVVPPAQDSFKRLVALTDELSLVLHDAVIASDTLTELPEAFRSEYARVLEGLAEDYEAVDALVKRDRSAVDDACSSVEGLTRQRDDLLVELNALENSCAVQT